MNAVLPESDDAAEIERGRSYIVRALVSAIAVYIIVFVIMTALGAQVAQGRALFKLAVIGGTGALVLGLRWNWARWLLVAVFLVFSLEWIALATIRNYLGMVAAPTHLACAVAVASRPARLYVQSRPSGRPEGDAVS